MNIIISNDDFKLKKSRDLIPIKCKKCEKIFNKRKNKILVAIKGHQNLDYNYCSFSCRRDVHKILLCCNCKKTIIKNPSELKKPKNAFCSSSCAAIYNNNHKTTGYRRSKLEMWLENQLTKQYPNLKIHFNKTDAINAELDIYIPSLKLAFELNGIFHYEPIYSQEKLKRTQTNDQRKFQACLENKIELCIIDVSKIKYFKPKNSEYFLKIITDIMSKKLDIL